MELRPRHSNIAGRVPMEQNAGQEIRAAISNIRRSQGLSADSPCFEHDEDRAMRMEDVNRDNQKNTEQRTENAQAEKDGRTESIQTENIQTEKAGRKDIFDRIMSTKALVRWEPLYRKYKEILLYLFFGGLTTVISIASYGLLVFSGMNALIANVISWILAVLFAYVTNSIWVFDGHVDTIGEKVRQIISFYGGRVLTLVMEEAILLIFVEILKQNALLVKIAAQILVVIGNYIISKLFVFRK